MNKRGFVLVFLTCLMLMPIGVLGWKINEMETTCGLFDCYTDLELTGNIPQKYIGEVYELGKIGSENKNIANKIEDSEIFIHSGNINDMTIEVLDKNTMRIYGKIDGATQNKWGATLLGNEDFKHSTWWNSSYDYRYNITNSKLELVISINGTHMTDIDNNTNNELIYAIPYSNETCAVYFNNDTDFEVANTTEKVFWFQTEPSFIKSDLSAPDGLISYWTGDAELGTKQIEDIINGHNSTTQGGSILTEQDCYIGECHDYSSAYQNIPSDTDFATTNRTVCFWIKSDIDDYTSDGGILHDRSTDYGVRSGIYVDDVTDSVRDWWGNRTVSQTGTVECNEPITTNWEFYCVRRYYDGTNTYGEIYKNGTSCGSVTKAWKVETSVISDSNDLRIGVLYSSPKYFDGLIDDIRWYDRPLSTTEIEKLYGMYQYLDVLESNITTTTTTTITAGNDTLNITLGEERISHLTWFIGIAIFIIACLSVVLF